MKRLVLLADDLTGALDTAAAFVPLVGTIHLSFAEKTYDKQAFNTGAREETAAFAAAKLAALVPNLRAAEISFLKVDSLLRGNPVTELAALWRTGLWKTCIIATAFPFQGRTMQGGVQLRNGKPVFDLLSACQAQGLEVHHKSSNNNLADGINICDAETEEDLAKIVALGRKTMGPVLWCGTAGLAQAMAGGKSIQTQNVQKPILGIFGSDQTLTRKQLEACGRHWVSSAQAPIKYAGDSVAMVTFDLAAGLSRDWAASKIREAISALVTQVQRPATLIASGGETLSAICKVIKAESLEVTGAIEPGIPCSILRGGIWDGVQVISKSGAFGRETLLRELIASIPMRIPA